jgi:PPP family 3-phenylpropionic acid transporter
MARALIQRARTRQAQVWVSCCYFWYFVGIGCFAPYIALYYRHLRLNGLQIGVLAAILPLGIAVVAPVWGALADTFSAHRLLLRCALVLAALTALMIAGTTSFIPLLLLMVLLAVFVSTIPTFLDSYAVTLSEREGASYGRLRVWGSVGFIGAVWLMAWWMGKGISHVFLIAYAAALLLTCGATFGLPALQPRVAKPMWQGISEIVRDRSVALLLLSVYLVIANATIISGYLSIYLTEIGGDAWLVGTASALGAISELPAMVFGRWLLDRFTSRKILVLAVAAYLMRLLLYSIPILPPWVLLIQLMHGLSFGLYLMASVTLVHELAGRARAATAQGLLSSTSLGFGAITGSLVGGALLDRIGAVGVFRVAAVGMLLTLLVCLFSVRTVGARRDPAHSVFNPSQE